MDLLKLETLEDVQSWAKENLITRNEAAKLTGQSYAAFSQAINLKYVVPFLEYGTGTRTVRLYLKSDIEAYAKRIEARKNSLSSKPKKGE